ncbi:Oxidoreductase family, NAD-binding Rossmann fold [Haladaptatus litoreus]|uniref:Oxidoreductase family, NAD-binding Rossmann fold n=1 Tax=Haladaptatus litoreus TaxID=553468 RepID=A0A1N7DGG4_9EURY|nr:Gfo/Idh/MocA family oxidoreductase [Haladaptatus litoreus]SIR74835.1 Oxidoreductase family, NAD-binding Rossmann fold [Haladaptatus litoreus]
MLDIGIIGLDTSHAEAFAQVIDESHKMTINGVWDTNSVRDRAYTETFASKYDALHFHNLDEMVPHIDAAMVLTVNWETHRPLATRFLEAGIPTFIDKPLAGQYEDITAIESAAQQAPLFGGSAVPFHPTIASLPHGEMGRTLFGAGYNDYFYYRVHLIDTVRLFASSNWTEIQPSDSGGTLVDIGFENATHATLQFDGCPADATFGLLDIGKQTRVIEIESSEDSLEKMYAPFIDSFHAVVTGERDDTQRLIDSATLLLGTEAAIETGQKVTPDSDVLTEICRDGDAFLAEYEPYY